MSDINKKKTYRYWNFSNSSDLRGLDVKCLLSVGINIQRVGSNHPIPKVHSNPVYSNYSSSHKTFIFALYTFQEVKVLKYDD